MNKIKETTIDVALYIFCQGAVGNSSYSSELANHIIEYIKIAGLTRFGIKLILVDFIVRHFSD